jgi:hypothetical protein
MMDKNQAPFPATSALSAAAAFSAFHQQESASQAWLDSRFQQHHYQLQGQSSQPM